MGMDNSILGSYAKKITKIVGLSFEGGGGENFIRPQYLPQFLSEGAQIFGAFRHFGGPLSF